MKIQELTETASAVATSAGSIAPMASNIGMVSRLGNNLLSGKYSKASKPAHPKKKTGQTDVGR
jgi:hypothetical protein